MDPKLFALTTALCFGLNPVTLKMGFARGGRPDTAMIIGLVLAVPLYALLLPLAGGLHWDQVTPLALAGFVLGGLLGTGIGRRWLYIAIDRIGASPATAIKNAAPVVSAILGVLFFGDQVTIVGWAAIVAIVAGVILLTWQSGEGNRRRWMDLGVLAAFGSFLAYGVRPLFLKFGLDEVNLPLTAALVAAITALTYVLVVGDRRGLRQAYRDTGFPLFVLSGLLQGIGFLALTFGLSGGTVSVVYPVTASAPLFTLGFTALLLRGREHLNWRIVAGAAAVVAGVIFL